MLFQSGDSTGRASNFVLHRHLGSAFKKKSDTLMETWLFQEGSFRNPFSLCQGNLCESESVLFACEACGVLATKCRRKYGFSAKNRFALFAIPYPNPGPQVTQISRIQQLSRASTGEPRSLRPGSEPEPESDSPELSEPLSGVCQAWRRDRRALAAWLKMIRV